MTTSTSPLEPAASAHRSLRLTDPGDVFAAVPALLGFRPHRSLIVACLGGESGTALGAVMRHDLVGESAMSTVVDRFVSVCARERASAALVLIVDDAAGEPVGTRGERDRFHEKVVGELAEQLADAGIALAGAHATRVVAPDAAWWGLHGDDRMGRIPDPETSPVAAAHVWEGRQIRGSRAELHAELDGDERVRAQVAESIDASVCSAWLEWELAMRKDDTVAYRRRKLEHVLWQIANVASGETLLAPEFAALALAVVEPGVRDALFALAVGEQAGPAEQLWTAMVRALPDPERADAAVLLGYSAYVRGDGALAGAALAVALDADPHHTLAGMLDNGLQNGMRPSALRELADIGFDVASHLGVTLPPDSRDVQR